MGCTSDNQASCVLYTILVSLANFRFSRKNNGAATMNVQGAPDNTDFGELKIPC